MRARRLIAAAVLVGLTGGCAAIPESSPVVPIGSEATDDLEAPVAGPADDLDPLSLVRDFIGASANPTNQYAAAKAYLTDEARASWTTGSRLVVLDDTFSTVFSTAADATGSAEIRQVLVRGQQVGELGVDGAFSSNRQTVSPTMTVVRQDGRWRISEPPADLVVRLSDFRTTYRSVGLRFVDPNRDILITDRRWVLFRPAAVVPGRVIDLLLRGPSAATRDAAVSMLSGAQTRTNVVVGESDALIVDLAGLPDLDERQRRLAVAQILGSLREVVPQRVRILNDGAPLVPNKTEWDTDEALRYVPDDSIKPDVPLLAVSDGTVLRVGDQTPIRGPAGDGSLAVESAAMSVDGEQLAVVTTGGGPRLHIGPVDAPRPVSLQASAMTRPTWRRADAPEVWTVIDGKQGVGVRRGSAGEYVPFGVNLSELSVKGRITELRLSRDGTRVAAVIDGALFVAVVVGLGAESRVVNPRLLVGPGAPQIADVDWNGPDRVVVATLNKDNPGVYDVTVDGLTWNGYEPTNLTGPLTGVATAVGKDVYVADQNGLWFAADTNDLWYSAINGRRADPFYPG